MSKNDFNQNSQKDNASTGSPSNSNNNNKKNNEF